MLIIQHYYKKSNINLSKNLYIFVFEQKAINFCRILYNMTKILLNITCFTDNIFLYKQVQTVYLPEI